MSFQFSRSLSAAALCLPVSLWFTDAIYSTCRVRGTSMEPTLKDGDILLVRKSDILADYTMTTTEDATDRARLKRMEATMSGSVDHPIMSRPPMVLVGHVVVFCNPKKAFPHEYHVKRVTGVGGQLVCCVEAKIASTIEIKIVTLIFPSTGSTRQSIQAHRKHPSIQHMGRRRQCAKFRR